MTENFYINLLLGHLVGDYLLQNDWMALNKNKNELIGIGACLSHCIIYSLSVVIFTQIISLWWFILVFISHYFIDRYSLAEKWLRFYGSRSVDKFARNGASLQIPDKFDVMSCHILKGSFTALVYAVADNTMHLILMIEVYKWLI